MGKLIIDGNSVYEIDEDCQKRRERRGKGPAKTGGGPVMPGKPKADGYGPRAISERDPRS